MHEQRKKGIYEKNGGDNQRDGGIWYNYDSKLLNHKTGFKIMIKGI